MEREIEKFVEFLEKEKNAMGFGCGEIM